MGIGGERETAGPNTHTRRHHTSSLLLLVFVAHQQHQQRPMPALPPNVEEQVKRPKASRKSDAVDLNIHEDDESKYEIPPGVGNTPWTCWGCMRYFGPGWLLT